MPTCQASVKDLPRSNKVIHLSCWAGPFLNCPEVPLPQARKVWWLREYCRVLCRTMRRGWTRLSGSFVCRLRSKTIQQCLLTKKDLTLKKAVDIALAMEAADKSMKGIEAAFVQKLKATDRSRSPCYSYRRKGDGSQNCCFRDATCYHYGNVGHITLVCRSDRKQACEGRRWNDDKERQL